MHAAVVNTSERLPTVAVLGTVGAAGSAGGLERFVDDLTRALAAAGVDVRAVVLEGEQAAAHPSGSSVAGIGLRVLRYARAARAPVCAADVVDVHFPLWALLPVLIARRAGRPVVAHVHGLWAEEGAAGGDGALRTAAKRAIERAVHRRAAEIVTLSEAVRTRVVTSSGVHPGRVTVISPGVDLERFRPLAPASARQLLCLDIDRAVIVAVRRLVPRTGVDRLVAALASTPLTGAHLVVIGEGPEREHIAQLVEDRGLGDRVRLMGRLPDEQLRVWYSAADVTAVPSRSLEGFGLTILESLACGTPVVATDDGGPPEVLCGLDPQLLAAPDNLPALAEALHRVLAGEGPTRAACRAAAERYPWSIAVERTLKVYERARAPLRSRQLRVVYLDHTAEPAGGELALARLLPGLIGVDPHVILGGDGPLADRLRRDGISVEVLPLGATSTLRRNQVSATGIPLGSYPDLAGYVLRLARRLRALGPDLVHTNSLKSAVYGAAAARLAGVPVVCHVRDRISPDYLPPAAIRLVRTLLRHVSAVIVDSAAVRATLGSADRVYVIPSPVDPTIVSRTRARRGSPLTVGLVGRLAPWKGQRLFLEAFARAFPAGHVRARIAGAALFGEQAYAQGLPEFARALGLEDRVTFVGHCVDVAAELATLDVLVHCSTLPEPFGQVVVEGMAAGLAVVATNAGGVREIVTDGVDGLLVDLGDTTQLSQALERLAGDAGLRKRLGARARLTAERYRVERVAPEVESVYRRVLAAGRRTGLSGMGGFHRFTALGVVATGPSYRRTDGVHVIALGTLGP